MIVITEDILLKLCPNANKVLVEQLVPELNKCLPYFGVDTHLEICHFLAQAAHETDSFNTLTEYASGRAYEFRADLGNVLAGQGVAMKGHGIFQTTGVFNHVKSATLILNDPFFGEERKVFADNAIMKNPSLLAQPQWAVASAGIYWVKKNLSAYCVPDTQMVVISRYMSDEKKWVKYSCSPIEAISRLINGGLNGYGKRKALYEKAKKLIIV